MNRFAYAQPDSFTDASTLLTDKRFSLPMLKAGGIDVLDHLKEGLIEPDVLVNVKSLRSAPGVDGKSIAEVKGRLHFEATATLSEIAASDLVRSVSPVIAQAIEYAASPQVRNVATAAGNLLQRPRCWYYRHEQFDCLKKGGARCYAVDGENKYHAVFGNGPCHIVHPSNLAPALMVTGAEVFLTGSGRESIPIASLFHMPDKGVHSENTLEPGEIVTHITCMPAKASGFYAIKEKQSFDWPLVTAAVVLELDGDVIKSARVCAGAVAPVPWALPQVEQALKGVRVGDEDALKKACAMATSGAKPMTDNAYKLKLLPVAVRRATLIAAGRSTEVES